ncbi:hypothetical protein [Heliophilum fasciatum]|uniref:Uncharacterized protein n=1 Tax=Heliophilum fasciatum TaxID=35700 RepID=A0A4V2SX37_9FIRM|nr:hypothetical protein [Heliophilum fasciatum]MCW2277759.1 hypothetical protein [Heliophilum fasciatum]TCP64746.1 hypothetical protein EDD73_10899 [Heliophilum fasciatum]
MSSYVVKDPAMLAEKLDEFLGVLTKCYCVEEFIDKSIPCDARDCKKCFQEHFFDSIGIACEEDKPVSMTVEGNVITEGRQPKECGCDEECDHENGNCACGSPRWAQGGRW